MRSIERIMRDAGALGAPQGASAPQASAEAEEGTAAPLPLPLPPSPPVARPDAPASPFPVANLCFSPRAGCGAALLIRSRDAHPLSARI